jgi:stringent starvation protein B
MIQELFTFSVLHNNQVKEFEARFQQYGYSYRITIPINGVDIIFEPDEERNYRAVVSNMNENKKDVDTKLVQAIAMKLEEMFK